MFVCFLFVWSPVAYRGTCYRVLGTGKNCGWHVNVFGTFLNSEGKAETLPIFTLLNSGGQVDLFDTFLWQKISIISTPDLWVFDKIWGVNFLVLSTVKQIYTTQLFYNQENLFSDGGVIYSMVGMSSNVQIQIKSNV